ncbi:MAG: hypothetical protein ACK499_04915 [Betaproteobacteria bacterium]|jgi:hypothetical protein|nr:hypothetical protein AEM42_00565 [Betaproteobacteria bacterium UKL13-2]HCG51962.1 hypothetical protein [Betaproteobacteria bacterium]
MNTKTMNKDNAGSTILLAAMILAIATVLFVGLNAHAEPVAVIAPKATAIQMNATNTSIETLVITATRLK